MSEEEENNEDENPADFEEEEFPEDIEEEEDLEDAPLDDDDDDDEDDESGPTPVADSSEDDDDEDPADVEADLDAILKDRIASGEDEEEEEEGGDPSTASKKEAPVQGEEDSVEARRKGEVICPSCFLIIEAQIAKETGECPHCGAGV